MAGKPSTTYRKVFVLRLGHRRERDKRVTTHVALVARAYGANGFILDGDCDENILENIRKVMARWGDDFYTECSNGLRYAEKWKRGGGEIVHLTMYGLPFAEVMPLIASSPRPKLVIVGSQKVPREYYDIADYNMSVGLQPHSEVAALASFLSALFGFSWLYTSFRGRKIAIMPSLRGKSVIAWA